MKCDFAIRMAIRNITETGIHCLRLSLASQLTACLSLIVTALLLIIALLFAVIYCVGMLLSNKEEKTEASDGIVLSLMDLFHTPCIVCYYTELTVASLVKFLGVNLWYGIHNYVSM